MKDDLEPLVKDEMKIEEDMLTAAMLKRDFKKEEHDPIQSKCFDCPTCSIRYTNEESFVEHIQQHHITSSKQGDLKYRQNDRETEPELCSSIPETVLDESNVLQLNHNQAISAHSDLGAVEKSIDDKQGEWNESSRSSRGHESSNSEVRQQKTAKASYKSSKYSYSTSKISCLDGHHTHTGEKTLQSSECSHLTCQKSDLVKDQRKNTEERPFQCFDCSYSTGKKSNLKVHQHLNYLIFILYYCVANIIHSFRLIIAVKILVQYNAIILSHSEGRA
jgi:hypothetical protein